MEKQKLLGLMRFWLFGTFLIVFAATTIYVGVFTGPDWQAALWTSLPVWGTTAVLCVAFYFVYKLYLVGRKK